MKKLIIYIAIIFSGISLFAQNKTTISGFIYDKNTGEVLIGATLQEKKTKKGTVSNEYGFYSLTVHSNDSLEIEVSYLGYKPLNFKIPANQNIHKDFKLTASAIILDNVTIVASKQYNIVKRNETGVVRLPIKDIKTLPNLFGEVDIIKAYQLTPGVQSGGEAKSELYVRGGSPDQNLFLLDDVPLYYVAHFGGFLSVFNADAINDVKLIKGGFPARYGSRLSSVLDIRMKEGNRQKLSVQGTIGLLSSKLSIEAPVIKDKMSFILSARKNLLPIFKIMGTGLSYKFYDINAKLNYRLSTKDKLFLSYYMGDDNLSISKKTQISKHNTNVKWGNTLFAFRWNHVFHNKLFSNLTLSNTYYRYKNSFKYDVKTDSLSKSLSNSLLTGINDMSLKLDFSYSVNANLNFRFGTNSIYHTFIPNDEFFSQEGTGLESIKENYSSSMSAIENALYLENELKFNIIGANMGFRYSSYHIGSTNYYSFEPRILLNFILSEKFSIKYSFSKMNQYVHLLAYSGVGIPSDYWMPTNENVKPENSLQNTIGISKTFQNNKYEFSIEAYHKTLNNLITFLPGESLNGNLGSWENVIEKNGTGLNYGLELFLQKKSGKTTGWFGVTISKAERTFDNINNGKSYPFKYDRLYDMSIVLNHKLNDKIVLSGTWTYCTGYPVTLATEHYTINDKEIFVYSNKNAFRMRDYHRLDIAVNFNKKTKWGKRTWSISIFNLYNRQNPYYYYYDRKLITYGQVGNTFNPVYDDLKLYQQSLFSLFPSVSYSFKF